MSELLTPIPLAISSARKENVWKSASKTRNVRRGYARGNGSPMRGTRAGPRQRTANEHSLVL
eukprot:scaffold201740_cov31-Tisochrysis_lutea.AAC.7